MKLSRHQLRSLILNEIRLGSTVITEVSANDLGVQNWGSFGRALMTTRTPSSLAGFRGDSVLGMINDWVLNGSIGPSSWRNRTKTVHNMASRGGTRVIAPWLLKQFPEVSPVRLGDGVTLVPRDGHSDIRIQCESWMDPIYVFDLVSQALDTAEPLDVIKNSVVQLVAETLEQNQDNISDDLRPIAQMAAQAAIKKFKQEFDIAAGSVISKLKNWRYLITRVLANDPLIIYLILGGKDVIEQVLKIKIGDNIVQDYVQDWLMDEYFPAEVGALISRPCSELRSILTDPLNSSIGDQIRSQMSSRGVDEEKQDELFSFLSDVMTSIERA